MNEYFLIINLHIKVLLFSLFNFYRYNIISMMMLVNQNYKLNHKVLRIIHLINNFYNKRFSFQHKIQINYFKSLSVNANNLLIDKSNGFCIFCLEYLSFLFITAILI